MKTTTFYRSAITSALFVAAGFFAQAQIAFTNSNSLIPTATHSGCAVTVVDVNGDGMDDIVKMDQSKTLVIDLQNQDGTLSHYNLGLISSNAVWGMAVADVDHNGWKDVVTGPNGALYLVKLSWSGSTIVATKSTLSGSYFVQNITFGDFNNDGWADLSVCDDNDYDKIYQNNSGTLTPTTTLINTNINPGMVYGNDPYDSGNYGSVWTDFDNDGDLDLYIAHCRQSTSSNTDQRRRDRLFVNNGSNVYTEAGQVHGIETTNFRQTWTTSFADIDNDGDFDIVMTNHGENGQILRNDAGNFTDITATSGFATTGADPIESMTEDFDNDGYIDVLVTGGGGGDSYFLYRNNHNSTFTLMTLPFASTTNGMLSAATGDLNHDGKVDVFASYGNVYVTPTTTDDVLYLNTTNNANHFITFNLKGTVSNQNAIGARVTIYGPWGKQIREVRAGEAYGTSNSMQLHFGLGSATTVDSVRINWPSHLTNLLTNVAANQFVTVVEGGCVVTDNFIPGPYLLCTGQSLMLNAAPGFSSYLWSNGATTQSTSVSSTGNYNVMVTTAGGCSNLSPSITVQLNPDETPSVTSAGSLQFCDGGNVTLTSTPAASYLWSPNGETTQSILATASGSYHVTIQGTCAPFSSSNINVSVLANPLPVTSNDSAYGAHSFTLNATGNNLSWWDAQTGGNMLGTGTSYITPVIPITTSYWVENATSYGGSNVFTGQPMHTGTSAYSGNTTNATMVFNVLNPCTLSTVKVYTDTPGNRVIQLKNSGGTVLNSATVNIPLDSSTVTLNFALTPGTNYTLGTDGTVNTTNFGYVSPRLQRSSTGVVYPYNASPDVSVTGSSGGSGIYYYFYNWKVTIPPTVCTSPRVEVIAKILINTGINNFAAENNFSVYPNPTRDNVTVSFNMPGTSSSKVEFIDAMGRTVSSEVIESNAGSFNRSFSVENFAKGVYTIHVSSGDKTSYQRLIIQ